MNGIVSSQGVPQTYLRISVTDRCNLRCGYCMPPGGRPLVGHADLLTYEELVRVAGILAGMGIRKVRVTGGEPLVRRDVCALLSGISAVEGVGELCITTNGTRLAALAPKIRDAGVSRVNVSLDSLRPDRYSALTGADLLDAVVAGLEAAARAGFVRVKLNTVLLRGVNDDEAPDFVRFSARMGFVQRFIELMPFRMPVGTGVPEREVREALSAAGIDSAHVEYISQVSRPFCDSCGRLRIDARGRLKTCLLSHRSLDVRSMLRGGADDRSMAAEMRAFGATGEKKLAVGVERFEAQACGVAMSEIGG
ncbi:MAG: GTP 3',8-cyclase MoaA [Deltaproteobacteria bacterium]|nr:GTP 3',8-cyclase MoaA [Deltaproteobacteria bacterium]